MGLKEEYKSKTHNIMSLQQFEQQQVRDLYVREMIFNIGDQVKYIKKINKVKC